MDGDYQRGQADAKEGSTQMNVDAKKITETILSLERGALDRWNKGDVEDSLEIYCEAPKDKATR